MDRTEEDGLIERSLSGDTRAYGTLIGAYERVLYNTALRMVNDREDAKDLTQTVLIKAYEHLSTFDRGRKFFSWIYRIMMNESLNFLQRRRRSEPLDEGMASPGRGPDRDAEEHEIGGLLDQAIAELKPDHRQVIVLRHIAQLSYEEMSGALDISEKTVKSRLFTARRILGEILERRGVTLT